MAVATLATSSLVIFSMDFGANTNPLTILGKFPRNFFSSIHSATLFHRLSWPTSAALSLIISAMDISAIGMKVSKNRIGEGMHTLP